MNLLSSSVNALPKRLGGLGDGHTDGEHFHPSLRQDNEKPTRSFPVWSALGMLGESWHGNVLSRPHHHQGSDSHLLAVFQLHAAKPWLLRKASLLLMNDAVETGWWDGLLGGFVPVDGLLLHLGPPASPGRFPDPSGVQSGQ